MSNLTWELGDVKVTRVVESVAPVPVQGLFPDATADDLTRHPTPVKLTKVSPLVKFKCVIKVPNIVRSVRCFIN